jgi:KaiC/GvpD/RAD55 family RecA-like ATPase
MHIPSQIKEALSRLGLDIPRLEESSSFRILDSYTGSTFLGPPQTREKRWQNFEKSLDLKDWVTGVMEESTNPLERDKNRLHMDDNTSVLLQHNSEKSFIDFWRTHIILDARILNLVILHAVVSGVYSETFYSQYEALCDGVIEFRGREERGRIEQYMRVRTMVESLTTLDGDVCDSWKLVEWWLSLRS